MVSGGIVISIAVGEERCSWLRALVYNALAFSWSTTQIVVHLCSGTLCSDEDIISLNGTNSRVYLNGVRLPTVPGTGLHLYAHLLNARFAAAKWPQLRESGYLILQASNMLWLRPNFEVVVQNITCSVDSSGWHGKASSRASALQNMAWNLRKLTPAERTSLNITERDWGDRISAKVYFNLTGSVPVWAGNRYSYTTGANVWSYHEGSFYPISVILRFLDYVDAHLTLDELGRATLMPEEFWLQAWVANREPTLRVHKQPRQLAARWKVTVKEGRVPLGKVMEYATALNASRARSGNQRINCSNALAERENEPEFHNLPFYAWKRFERNLSDLTTAAVLKLRSCFRVGPDAGRGCYPRACVVTGGGADSSERPRTPESTADTRKAADTRK